MSQSDLMTCREVIEFLADYLDAAMPESQRREFERHLRVCPSCVAYLDSYRRTVELGREALSPGEKPAREVFPPGLLQAISNARRTELGPRP